MSPHPYEDLYDDYQEETVVEAGQPPRHYQKRPPLHSVPLRTMRTARWQTGDDIAAMFADPRAQPPIQRPAARQAAPAQQKSHIPHTALQAAVSQDRRVGKSQLTYTDEYGRQVWRQGNKEVVFQEVAPPPPRRRPRLHWMLWVGLGMLLTIGLFVGWNDAAAALAAHNLDSKYGSPRTWQTDAVVGHNDSPAHPSHFVFSNLHGKIIIDEYPGGDIAHARIYSAGAVFSDQLPVTGRFEDVNHDGRPDMLVEIGTDTPNTETLVFLNNGTQFVPPA